MQLNSSGFILGIIFIVRLSYISLAYGEKVLATVPNLDINVLRDILFMEIVRPTTISFTYKIRPAKNFGTSFSRRIDGMELVLAQPYYGCSSLSNTRMINNRVVMMQRGECSFVTKSIHAQEAGALAVIITDSDVRNDKMFLDMVDDETKREVYIPAFFLLGKDGYVIKNTLEGFNLDSAIINIPINVTNANVYSVNQPPWTLW